MGRWDDSDDEKEASSKPGTTAGKAELPRKKREAPIEEVGLSELFIAFQAEGRSQPIMVDVRRHDAFKHGHLLNAFCVSVSESARPTLVDSSSKPSNDSQADQKRFKLQLTRGKWGQDIWMGRDVLLYGQDAIPKNHPVIPLLQRDESTLPKRILVLNTSFEDVADKYPGLTSSFRRPRAGHRYPSELIHGRLYLGDWSHAEDYESLDQLNIQSVITIHNRPTDIRYGGRRRHLPIEQEDTDTHAIRDHFPEAFAFIKEASLRGHACLIHCGAGISRSATLAVAYLMHHFKWDLAKTLAYVSARRSVVRPNEGFLKALKAFERHEIDGGGDGGGAAKRNEEREEMLGEYGGVRVVIMRHGEKLGEVRVEEGKEVTVGRTQPPPWRLDHESCSRAHASFFLRTKKSASGLSLKDLKSAHGTRVDGKPIKPNEAVTVYNGQKIMFGGSSREYVVTGLPEEGKKESERDEGGPGKRQRTT